MYDLHTHSTCSDGSIPPAAIPQLALRQKLQGFALTDHDTMRGVADAQQAGRECGVDVLAGAEISAFDPSTGLRVHLLALLPKRIDVLSVLFDRMHENRESAVLRSFEVLKKRYPITEEDVRRFSASAGTIFRAHIMRALMEQGYSDRIFGDLYYQLFSRKEGIAYCPVEYIPMEEAAATARDAGCCVILAHPGVYDSFGSAERLASRGLIDGIERDYPRRKEGEIQRIDALIERYRLLGTGATDFHGCYASPAHPMATCATPDEVVDRIRDIAEKR